MTGNWGSQMLSDSSKVIFVNEKTSLHRTCLVTPRRIRVVSWASWPLPAPHGAHMPWEPGVQSWALVFRPGSRQTGTLSSSHPPLLWSRTLLCFPLGNEHLQCKLPLPRTVVSLCAKGKSCKSIFNIVARWRAWVFLMATVNLSVYIWNKRLPVGEIKIFKL